MKKNRIFYLVTTLVLIICTCTVCKLTEGEFAEVYTKFSKNEISFLSTDTQDVTFKIKVFDGDNEMDFKKKISILSNEETSLLLNDITDESFFSSEARITGVTLQKQEENMNSITFKRAILVVILCTVFLIMYCIFYNGKENKY